MIHFNLGFPVMSIHTYIMLVGICILVVFLSSALYFTLHQKHNLIASTYKTKFLCDMQHVVGCVVMHDRI